MASEARYKLLYDDFEPSACINIPFGKLAWATVALPLLAFVFCVIYSIIYNFESTTFSHCHVYNFLPSISSAIGNFSPQREVWQLAVALHALPRFCVAIAYLQYHREVLFPWAFYLSSFACFLNVVENFALIILSFWTSSENYPIHKTAFITFIITSEFYMMLAWALNKRCRRHQRNLAETKSLKWKKRLVVFNISCIVTATYFFIRHNMWCEKFVYSAFAFFEYMVVLSNMAFHMTAYLDFKERNLVVSKSGVSLRYDR
ncbi:hypothetical protein RN001_003888 [Aquatica leii]|uniref:CWH43-like N-terminal domain-containing protein n=1 Tax=Aquatica leii TaxID=1421715 RepID=A0AAN7Q9Z0_9COLE|nr:hypothetical protein RN001_003888 [Aquatica leii]